MNKIIPLVLCSAVLFGCRTRPITPDQSWADYCRYYSPTGETAAPPDGAVDFRKVSTAQVDANLANLKLQGYVVLGCFKIEDGTDITYPAIMALAQKLNAGAVVMSTKDVTAANSPMPNPDLGIVGTDKMDSARMNVTRPEETLTEQIYQHYAIYMLGKKSRSVQN